LTLETRARESLHRLFAKECDGERDAMLAASAIWYALEMEGPAHLAALRIYLAHGPASTAERFLEECRALTLAMHAGTWVSFVQMFGSNEDVDREITAYLRDFVPRLYGHLRGVGPGRVFPTMRGMAPGRFSPIPGSDQVFAWGAALGIVGKIWVEGRKQGIAASALMDLLWQVD
jgi:hypothetical protein